MADVTEQPPIVLAHAAEPALLIGGPLLMIAVFAVLEVQARRRHRESEEDQD